MEQVLFGGYYFPLTNSAITYNSIATGYQPWPTENQIYKLVTADGKIKKLRVELLDGAPGGGTSYDFTLMVNGNPTALTLEIADAATSNSNTVNEVAVSAGDTVSLRCSPTNTPTARRPVWTSVFEGDNANESLIMGGTVNALNKTTIEYGQVMGGATLWNVTENDHRQVIPTSGTIKDFYVKLNIDPGTAPDAYRFTVRLNGATVAQSLIVTITANDTTGNDLVHNLVVAPGDVLTMMAEPLNGPSSTPWAQWGMTFVADVDGESIVLSGTTDLPSNSAAEYNYLSSYEKNVWTGTAQGHQQLGQTCVVKKLYVLLSGSPGVGNKYDFSIDVAGSNTVVATVDELNLTGNSGALTDTVAIDDLLTIKCTPDSTPNPRAPYWGFVSYIAGLTSGSADLKAIFEVGQDSANLFAEVTVRQPGSIDLYAEVVVAHLGSAELAAEFMPRRSASLDLSATFEVRCYRSFGENWQRKSWHAPGGIDYFWRSRYDETLDSLVFEYIAEAGIESGSWTENTNARIDASSFTNPEQLSGDFAVSLPPPGTGVTTVVYSDGVDIWVAESDESSATGWSWENLTKVADETGPDWYRYVNINHDYRATTRNLFISAVYYQDGGGTYHVRMWRQSNPSDITAWDAPEDVSNTANTNRILGQASRHAGDQGLARYDMIFVYKEGAALRSRFWDGTVGGGVWETIQDIDTTASSDEAWLAEFDIEHSDLAGAHIIHIIYIDADGSVASAERGAGDTDVWVNFELLDTSSTTHHYVALVRAGEDWVYHLWQEGSAEIGWRIHIHDPSEVWVPPLASAYYEFMINTAIDPTTTLSQISTPDEVHAGDPVPISWAGVNAGVCDTGWGLLLHATEEDLFAKFEVNQSNDSKDLFAEFTVRRSDTADLFAEFELQLSQSLFAEFIVRPSASADLLGVMTVRNVTIHDLYAKFEVGQGSVDLYAQFETQATENLFAEFELQKSEDLKAVFVIGQGAEDLFAEFELQVWLDMKSLALVSGMGYVVKGGTPF